MSSSSGNTTPPSSGRRKSTPPPPPTVKRRKIPSELGQETDKDTVDTPPKLALGILQELKLASSDGSIPRNAIIFGIYADAPESEELDQPDAQRYEGFLRLHYGDAPVQIPIVIPLGIFSTPEQTQIANEFARAYFNLKCNPLMQLPDQYADFMRTESGHRITAKIDGALNYIREMELREQPIPLETDSEFYVILHKPDGEAELHGMCGLTTTLYPTLYENVYFCPAEGLWYFTLDIAADEISTNISVLYGRFHSAVEAVHRYYLLAQATFEGITPLIRNLPIADELMLQMRRFLPAELPDEDLRERDGMLAALAKIPQDLDERLKYVPRGFAVQQFTKLPTAKGLLLKPTPTRKQPRPHTSLGIPDGGTNKPKKGARPRSSLG